MKIMFQVTCKVGTSWMKTIEEASGTGGGDSRCGGGAEYDACVCGGSECGESIVCH